MAVFTLQSIAVRKVLETVASLLNVGKSTVIEAVQDVANGLYELHDNYIKFSETLAEVNTSIATFADLANLPNVVGG